MHEIGDQHDEVDPTVSNREFKVPCLIKTASLMLETKVQPFQTQRSEKLLD